MDVSQAVRKAYYALLTPLTIEGVEVPVFDEMVNTSVTIPTLRGAKVYVVIQDQQENEGAHTYCAYVQQCTITIRIVTKFNGVVVNKEVAELISNEIQNRISDGKNHNLTNIGGYSFQDVRKELSRTYTEHGQSTTVINKAIIYNNKVSK